MVHIHQRMFSTVFSFLSGMMMFLVISCAPPKDDSSGSSTSVADTIPQQTEEIKPAIPTQVPQGETSLHGISYYVGIDLPAPPFIFLSILNPLSEKVVSMKFKKGPQSRIHSRTFYTPQVEDNLYTFGISASKFMNFDPKQVRDSLFKDIENNLLEITYKDSTKQMLTINKIPKWSYHERGQNDTIPISFW